MKKYKSHKIVEAFQVDRMVQEWGKQTVALKGANGESVDVSREWIDRNRVYAGGYYIKNPDDHHDSFLSEGDFEADHTEAGGEVEGHKFTWIYTEASDLRGATLAYKESIGDLQFGNYIEFGDGEEQEHIPDAKLYLVEQRRSWIEVRRQIESIPDDHLLGLKVVGMAE